MKEFAANKCRICPKVFCCKNCREKHEINNHELLSKQNYDTKPNNTFKTPNNVNQQQTVWPQYCILCYRLFQTCEEFQQHRKCPLVRGYNNNSNSNRPGVRVITTINNSEDYESPPFMQQKGGGSGNDENFKVPNVIFNLATSTPMQRPGGDGCNTLDIVQQVIITPTDSAVQQTQNKPTISTRKEGNTNNNNSGLVPLKRRVTFGSSPIPIRNSTSPIRLSSTATSVIRESMSPLRLSASPSRMSLCSRPSTSPTQISNTNNRENNVSDGNYISAGSQGGTGSTANTFHSAVNDNDDDTGEMSNDGGQEDNDEKSIYSISSEDDDDDIKDNASVWISAVNITQYDGIEDEDTESVITTNLDGDEDNVEEMEHLEDIEQLKDEKNNKDDALENENNQSSENTDDIDGDSVEIVEMLEPIQVTTESHKDDDGNSVILKNIDMEILETPARTVEYNNIIRKRFGLDNAMMIKPETIFRRTVKSSSTPNMEKIHPTADSIESTSSTTSASATNFEISNIKREDEESHHQPAATTTGVDQNDGSNSHSSLDSENKSVDSLIDSGLWKSLTKVIGRAMTKFQDFKTGIEQQQQTNDDAGGVVVRKSKKRRSCSLDQSSTTMDQPAVKRYKLIDIKCRRAIRDLPPIDVSSGGKSHINVVNNLNINIVNNYNTNSCYNNSDDGKKRKILIDKATQTGE